MDYIIGMDIAEPESKDFSVVSLLCKNCNSIIHQEIFIGDQPISEYPKECLVCEVKFNGLINI